MKNVVKIVILLVALAISNVAFSAQVSENTAKSVAFNFLSKVTIDVKTSNSLSLIYISKTSNQNLIYVFGYKNCFVIVAGDDRVTPILGYSTESAFIVPGSDNTDRGNNFWKMIKDYESQIKYAVDKNIATTYDISSKWSNFISPSPAYKSSMGTTTVLPLLTTTWDQGWPYNALCPSDASGPGGHVWAGCVSVAMAQILKYHNYPNQGLGSYGYTWGSYPYTGANFGATTYNWGSMPNSISATNNDIATLIYQTAVSCRSMWGAANTGVSYLSGEDPMTRAFVNYFKCAFSTIKYVSKGSYSDVDWDNLIQNELTNNRPVYYSGDGSLGHAWVCDGVDASNMYHFNWGWGGLYNGYYALINLNPGGNTLTNNQEAIIGIKPNDGSTLVDNTTWSGNATINTNIAVPDAITLTVNPGAITQFAQNCKLQVWGRILANGTSGNYAKFTAVDQSAGWLGIKFDNNYMNFEVMSDNDVSEFVYAQIEYSKMRGITIKNFSKVEIDNCKINNNYIDGDEYGYNNGQGAGIYANYSTVQIYNSEIYNNHATIVAGGILLGTGDITTSNISQNNIHDNISDGDGGGFYLSGISDALITGNTIYNNQAIKGAGGAIMFGSPNVVNNKFCNNSAKAINGKGLALYLESSNVNIVNNLFANNGSSNGYGAASLYITNGSPQIVNNTIVNNYSYVGSGIIFVNNANAYVKNCIIYGNQATNYGNQISIQSIDSDPYFDYCNIQGGLSGFGGVGSGTNYTTSNYTNNIDSNPLFLSPSTGKGNGYNGLTADWSLQSGSPSINTGDITGISSLLPSLDLASNPRINGIIDMGAYENGGFLSINDVEIINVNIFPNPCYGIFTVSCDKPISGVYLYDVCGRVVNPESFGKSVFKGNQSITMDFRSLIQGMYFVHIYMGNENTVQKIFVN